LGDTTAIEPPRSRLLASECAADEPRAAHRRRRSPSQSEPRASGASPGGVGRVSYRSRAHRVLAAAGAPPPRARAVRQERRRLEATPAPAL